MWRLLVLFLALAPWPALALTWDDAKLIEANPGEEPQVALVGHVQPHAKVQVQLREAIVIRAAPADAANVSDLKFPLSLPSYLKATGQIEEAARPAEKSFRTSTKVCPLLRKPRFNSPRAGRVTPGQRLWTKPYDEHWFFVYGKNSVSYISDHCLEEDSNQSVLAERTTRVAADSTGRFEILLQLPNGHFQIPVEVTEGISSSSYITRVSVLGNRVLLNDFDYAKTARPTAKKANPLAPRPSPASTAMKVQVWAGLGIDRQSYSQSTDGGDLKFSNTALSAPLLDVFLLDRRFGLEVLYRWANGQITGVSAPLVAKDDRYLLQQGRLLGRYNFTEDRKSRLVFGTEIRRGPFIVTDASNEISISDHILGSLVTGVGAEWLFFSSWSFDAEFTFAKTITQRAGSQSVSSGSDFGFAGRAAVRTSLSPRVSVSCEAGIDWLKNKLDSANRTLMEIRLDTYLGLEF